MKDKSLNYHKDIKYTKFGPFITNVTTSHKGKYLTVNSRAIRKSFRTYVSNSIASFFMIGSFCFIFASMLSLYFEKNFSNFTVNIIYFIGSIFFTLAAYGQYLESINSDITSPVSISKNKSRWKFWSIRPRNLGYLSSITQFIGTILFNINTFDAFDSNLTPIQTNLLVWIPDKIGSSLFLISSFFAWLEMYKDSNTKRFISLNWWIVWINILGSVLFQISAFASFVNFSTGKPLDLTLSLYTTLFGAICFFIGAFLMLFEKYDISHLKESSYSKSVI